MSRILDFLSNNQWLTCGLRAVVAVIITFILIKLIPLVEKFILRHITGRTKTRLDDQIIHHSGKTLKRVVWLGGIFFVAKSLQSVLLGSAVKYINGILYIILVFLIVNFLSSIFQLLLDWYSKRWGKTVNGRTKDEFGPLFRRLIVIVVYTIGLVFILNHFHQDVSSIIVSLGVGSLAVALAAKDTLANMISGFMIMTDRPFRIGDRIRLESGEIGDVYDIGLRSTKILTFDNTLIVVPNQQIINEKVTNLSYPDPQIRVKIEVGVAYGTDLDRVKSLLVKICKKHPEVLDDPPPKAYFINFGDSSLDMMLVCRVGEWGQQWRVGEELRMDIKKTFEKEGIEIPFPQRVITINKSR